jgi:DNA polymerase III alpha subunit
VGEREPKAIKNIEKREGLIMNECQPWCPNGDVQEVTNKFVLQLAQKHDIPVLVSDDAHFAKPEQKVVQDIRLATGGGWKFTTPYYRLDSDTAYEHFRATLGLEPAEFEGWVENNREWAQRFKAFKFTDRRSLPTHFYPKETLRTPSTW